MQDKTYQTPSLSVKQLNDYDGLKVVELSISDVFPNPNQPRKNFDKTALYELAESIKTHGIIQPIVVSKSGNKFMIIAGERRFRASKLAEQKTIPAIIKDYDDKKIKEIAIIENLQRENLNPIEAANAMKKLMEEYSLTQEELAERLGKSRSSVANTLRLLTLSQTVIQLVEKGSLSQGHARALVTLPKREQEKLALKTVEKGLSVREVEKLVKKILDPESQKPQKAKRSHSVELKNMIERMQRVFGTKISAIGNDNKGRIYVDYFTRDDLDRISDLLSVLEKDAEKNS